MRKTLIKRLSGDNGKLYIVAKGIRNLYEVFDVELHLYEESHKVPRLGATSPCIVRNRISIVFCEGVDADAPTGGESYALEVDLQRDDGVYERTRIEGLNPVDINIDGAWEFEIDPLSIDWSIFQ